MNTLFKHFILTRFNLIDLANYHVSYDYVNSDEYLSKRFHLFDTYCFPSISNQTNKNFTWILLFNDKFPEKWKKKLEEYKQICPNMEFCYMPIIHEGKWKESLTRVVKNELNALENNPQYLLTTRFDNDDALHFSFVDSIQKHFLEHQEEAIINYANGLQYIPKYNILKNFRVINGHFGTLIEKNDNKIRTVLSFSHNPLPDDLPSVKSLRIKKRMWLESIHSTNVFNAASFKPYHLFDDLFFIGFKYKNLNDFGIKQDIPRINFYVWKVFFKWFFSKLKIKIINNIFRR